MNFEHDLIKLGTTNPDLRVHIRPLLKVAMEHATPEALKKYLHEHPDADKSKHHVKKDEGGGESGSGDGPVNLSREGYKAVSKALQGFEAPGSWAHVVTYANSGKPFEAKHVKKVVDDIEDYVKNWNDPNGEAKRGQWTPKDKKNLTNALAILKNQLGGKKGSTDIYLSIRDELVKLGTTNPELRPHIRQILAGCEKLPEGGMRDNCEAKKNEGGKEAGVPEKHQLRILKDTVRNPSKGKFLGGPSAEEAEETLRKDFKYTDKQIADLKKSASFDLESELIKLGTTNPELRPHIREIMAGCEKLPEGGMRDNCEKKKEEGGKDEGADKTADLGGMTYLNRMPPGLIPLLNRVDGVIGGNRLIAFAFAVRLLNLVGATDEAKFVDRYLARNRNNVDMGVVV